MPFRVEGKDAVRKKPVATYQKGDFLMLLECELLELNGIGIP